MAKSTWRSLMLTYGAKHCDALGKMKDGPLDPALAATYYDAIRVYYQIADYTKDPKWNACAEHAVAVYRDRYVTPNGGKVPGYWNFTHGLRMHFERTGDQKSKDAVIALSRNASYAGDGTPVTGLIAGMGGVREVSYALQSFINAEAVGAPARAQRGVYLNLLHKYIGEFTDPSTWGKLQVAPFMAGLMAEAIIADWETSNDPRALPGLKKLADFLSVDAWVPANASMRYLLNPNPGAAGGPRSAKGAPDLNNLIAPMYAWLWMQTGDVKYRDMGDELFAGSAKAYVTAAKQFNQSYRWSFDFVKWRSGGR